MKRSIQWCAAAGLLLAFGGAAAHAIPPVGAKEEKNDATVVAELKNLTPKDTAFVTGRPPQPRVLKSEKDAAAYFDDAGLAQLRQQVDFGKQAVLLFAWRGSGQDKLTAVAGATFVHKAGLTRDLRPHVAAYALPANARWRVVIDWNDAKSLILNAPVQSVFQTHNREVTINLANGTRYLTVEPNLDDVIKLIRDNKKDIPIATE
ncbi:MAG: hypothetical protein U0744_13140 [Gemmataceae bacterium]